MRRVPLTLWGWDLENNLGVLFGFDLGPPPVSRSSGSLNRLGYSGFRIVSYTGRAAPKASDITSADAASVAGVVGFPVTRCSHTRAV